jgi:hypothetical protein
LEQRLATGEILAAQLVQLLSRPEARGSMRAALSGFHNSDAAALIAERMLAFMEAQHGRKMGRPMTLAPDDASQLRSSPRTA